MGVTAPRQCCKCSETRKIHAFDMCRRCYNRANVVARKAERRRHYLKYRERINARTKAYYHKNRDRCAAQQREYRGHGEVPAAPEPVRVPVNGWGVRV